jgi:hypothetical protein
MPSDSDHAATSIGQPAPVPVTQNAGNNVTPRPNAGGEQIPVKQDPEMDPQQPEHEKQDQWKLEQHTRGESTAPLPDKGSPETCPANKPPEQVAADKNPQVPANQQHQAPGSAPINGVKQQQGLDVLVGKQ